jgi:SpoIID/LytB domain protein
MRILNRFARAARLRVVASLVLSACLLPDGGRFFEALAQQTSAISTSTNRNDQDREPGANYDFARPRRIDLASRENSRNAEDGPVIRVALMTDVSSVTLGSSSGLTALRSVESKPDGEKIASHPVRIELKQHLARIEPNAPAREPSDDANKDVANKGVENKSEYRVEVGSVSDMLEARKVIDDLKKRFDEPTSNIYDRQSNAFRILIGRFASRSEAMAMIDHLRREGYAAARLAPDYGKSDQSSDKNSKPPHNKALSARSTKKTKSSKHIAAKVKRSKPQPARQTKPEQASAAPQYRQITQIVAMEGDRLIAATEGKLVAMAATSASEIEARQRKETQTTKREDAPPQAPSYTEKRKRDEQALWGADARAAKDESPRPAASAVLAFAGTETSRASSFIRVDDKYYRGEISLTLNSRGKLDVINALPLEQYLRGVVPMELSPGLYPAIEALKAQAVAARTYALAHINQSREADFDLRDDTRSQVYGGISAEHEMTNRAIEETRGIAVFSATQDGTEAPIEALYTANCGGQTENNEVIFGGNPMSYLRSVACAPDGLSSADRRIASTLSWDSLAESDGRLILRELALFQVMGFQLPRRATNSYLRAAPDADELQGWIDRASELSQKEKLRVARADSTRLPGFALMTASAIYGEGRAALLMTPADVDYMLAGLEGKDTPPDVRASIAALLKDGILRLPASSDGFDARAQITRAFAIETLARAISFKSSRAETSGFKTQMAKLRVDAAKPAENGRLIIASSTAKPPVQTQELASAKMKDASAVRPVRSTGEMKSKEIIARTSAVKESSIQKSAAPDDKPDGFEVDRSAWLFRSLGGQSYPVERLTLIGGEKIVFHLNAAGRVDFLEAATAPHSASSDRYSSIAEWQERMTVEEAARRLARARINVGQIESITPVAFSESNRVTEIEITGYAGSARLRGPHIRSAFGLKENLFVVDREMDASGHIAAFVFTGRGWGHGVGMCQTGAYGLAKEGYSYTAILQKYYTGVKLRKAY